jgi:hypothetical protein
VISIVPQACGLTGSSPGIEDHSGILADSHLTTARKMPDTGLAHGSRNLWR